MASSVRVNVFINAKELDKCEGFLSVRGRTWYSLSTRITHFALTSLSPWVWNLSLPQSYSACENRSPGPLRFPFSWFSGQTGAWDLFSKLPVMLMQWSADLALKYLALICYNAFSCHCSDFLRITQKPSFTNLLTHSSIYLRLFLVSN